MICNFHDEVVTCYSELLQSIQKKYLQIFDKPTTIPDHFAGLDLGHVGSLEDLKFSVSLTNGLRDFVKQNGLQRTAKHILPTMVSMWNATKGGVDQTSRYLKEVQTDMDHALSPTQRLWVRTIKLWLLNCCHICRNANIHKLNTSGKLKGWKTYRKLSVASLSFEDFLVEASEALSDFCLPGGGVGPCIDIQSTKLNECDNDTELPMQNSGEKRRRFSKGTTVYNHRKAWSDDAQKVRCRLAKAWRKQGLGEDDGENHEHRPIPLDKRTTKCVLCCKLCFSTDGKVFIRDKYHLGNMDAKSQVDTIETRDYGRQGNGASVKCSVCAVHLCHSKPRFPNGTQSCFDLWHQVSNVMTGNSNHNLRPCHIPNPNP